MFPQVPPYRVDLVFQDYPLCLAVLVFLLVLLSQEDHLFQEGLMYQEVPVCLLAQKYQADPVFQDYQLSLAVLLYLVVLSLPLDRQCPRGHLYLVDQQFL